MSVMYEGSAMDRIWDKQRFQILFSGSNLKSQSFQKVGNLKKIDLIIKQILYLA